MKPLLNLIVMIVSIFYVGDAVAWLLNQPSYAFMAAAIMLAAVELKFLVWLARTAFPINQPEGDDSDYEETDDSDDSVGGLPL